MIRPEIEELERLGPLPADDDDYPGIDRKLFGVEHLLAVVDPPVIETLGAGGLGAVVTGVDSAQWRKMFEQRLENAEDPRRSG